MKPSTSILMLMKVVFNLIVTRSGYRLDYLKSLVKPKALMTKPLPWMNYEAIEYISSSINAGSTVFEYGSGSSTQYWIARGCKVKSVEHDRLFFDKLSNKIDSYNVQR